MAEPNPNPTARDDDKQGEGEGKRWSNVKRHKHELLLFEGLAVYTCRGCKEEGSNRGYKCTISSSSKCEKFTWHEFCATLPDDIQHPIRKDLILKFRSKTNLPHHCSACQEVMGGFVFETEGRSVRLHPLCMMLPRSLDYSGHADHKLKFVTGELKGKAYSCSSCRRSIDRGGWRYQCEVPACNFYVDLRCAKNDHFGLPEHIPSTSGGKTKSSGRKTKTSAVLLKSIISGAVIIGEAIFGGAVGELFQNQSSEEQ